MLFNDFQSKTWPGFLLADPFVFSANCFKAAFSTTDSKVVKAGKEAFGNDYQYPKIKCWERVVLFTDGVICALPILNLIILLAIRIIAGPRPLFSVVGRKKTDSFSMRNIIAEASTTIKPLIQKLFGEKSECSPIFYRKVNNGIEVAITVDNKVFKAIIDNNKPLTYHYDVNKVLFYQFIEEQLDTLKGINYKKDMKAYNVKLEAIRVHFAKLFPGDDMIKKENVIRLIEDEGKISLLMFYKKHDIDNIKKQLSDRLFAQFFF